MKLLVQSDDYGITPAQAAGCIYGIQHGIIRNTGMFTNMAWSEECVRQIYPYLDQIALGIDLNASTGSSILSHKQIPSLTHEDGSFLTSMENRALDNEENDFDHMNYDELYAEFDAQVQKFVNLLGRLPDYIHGHAYQTKTTNAAISAIAEKYDRPYCLKFMEEKYGEKYAKMSWVKMGEPSVQDKSDLKNYLLNDEAGFLNKEVGYLVTHCGYVDSEIMKLSSFNMVRMRDLEALTCDEVLNWVKENSIELVTFKELFKEKKNEIRSEL